MPGAKSQRQNKHSGQDIYDSGFRHHGAFEQAYAGVVLDLPGEGNGINVSAGRQIYQLRWGFLISKIPGMETRARITGATVGYDDGWIVDAAFTCLEVPRSYTRCGVGAAPTEIDLQLLRFRLFCGDSRWRDVFVSPA